MELEFLEDGQKPPSKTRLYRVWKGMRERCYYEKHKGYKNYGGRGITVCEEWKNSFAPFRDWAMTNGYKPNAPQGECTLDRIDNSKGYSPDNCRWVSQKEQCQNRRKRIDALTPEERKKKQKVYSDNWYAKNREHYLENKRAYYQTHKAEKKTQDKRYYLANREKILQRDREYHRRKRLGVTAK